MYEITHSSTDERYPSMFRPGQHTGAMRRWRSRCWRLKKLELWCGDGEWVPALRAVNAKAMEIRSHYTHLLQRHSSCCVVSSPTPLLPYI